MAQPRKRPARGRRGNAGRHKTDPKPAKILGLEVKTARALELAQDGWSYGLIADTLTAEFGEQYGKTSKTTAFRLVKAALEEATARRKEAAESLVELEISRLDEMTIGVMPKAKGGDTFAISSVLAIMDRRARYLGLNAAEKKEITGKDGGPIESVTAIKDAADEFDRRIAIRIAARRRREADEGSAGGVEGEPGV